MNKQQEVQTQGDTAQNRGCQPVLELFSDITHKQRLKKQALKRPLKDRKNPQFFSIAEVCDMTGLGRTTIWRKIQLGRLTNGRDGLWPTNLFGTRTLKIPAIALQRLQEGTQI